MDDTSQAAVCVKFSVVEDVRRALLCELKDLPERKRVQVALRLSAQLREQGLLASSVEQHYKLTEAAALVARTPRHVVDECKAGRFGPVYRDNGGWIIPASGIHAWLSRKLYSGSVNAEVVA